MKKIYHELYGGEFTVESDHKPIKSIFKVKSKSCKTVFVSRNKLPNTQDEIPEININQIQLRANLPISGLKYRVLK